VAGSSWAQTKEFCIQLRTWVKIIYVLKNVVFCDVKLCDFCKKRRFGGRSASIIRVTRIGKLGTKLAATSSRRKLRRNSRLLVTINIVPSSLVLVTLMMEAIRSSETSVLTRATRRSITEYGILHSRRRENLKSDISVCCATVGHKRCPGHRHEEP
jgi:hypothetical protein